MQPFAAYPRWLVIICLALVAVAVGWLLAKVIGWTIHLIVAVVVALLVVGLLIWLLG